MKLGELKIIHIIIALALILWGILFFDNQWNKRIAQLERNQIIGAVNSLDNRIRNLEGGRGQIIQPSPPQSQSIPKGGK